MSDEPLLWPRMDRSMAERRLEQLGDIAGPEVDMSTEHFSFSGVGRRASAVEITKLRDRVIGIATAYGFSRRYGFNQEADPGDEARSRFDFEVFGALPALMPMNWSEAGSCDMWSWCSIVLLPDVTHWRWRWSGQTGRWNRERWIGSDLTRHTWGRQWWRSVQLTDDPELAQQLRENEFNQLTERANTIGANPLLVSTFARRFLEYAAENGIARRALLRDASQRLLRHMYFLDDSLMSETDLIHWSDQILAASVEELRQGERSPTVTAAQG